MTFLLKSFKKIHTKVKKILLFILKIIFSQKSMSFQGSEWVVYARDGYLITALPDDMKHPQGKWGSMGMEKIPDITHININEKMKVLEERDFVELIPRNGTQYLAFQRFKNETGDRNITCHFYATGIQAGTIEEIRQALLDIQSWQSAL